MSKRLGMFTVTGALLLGGCAGEDGGESDTADTAGEGDIAYYNGDLSAALGSSTNKATCATCHSNDGSQDGYSGNTMKDIAYHESFKGGGAPTLLDGANACVVGWMGGTALTEDSAEWAGLGGYLRSISDMAQTTPNAIAPEVLADEAAYEAAYAGGDAAAGEAKYMTACGVCHGGGLTVNATAAYPKATLMAYSVGWIARKVRTSGEPPSGTADMMDLTPGPMPFFEEKDLSTQDLKDIIAHLKG